MDNEFVVREIEKSDANAVVELLNRIDSQTDFMKCEPGERTTDKKRIKEIIDTPHDTIFITESDSKLVAYLLFFGSSFVRKKHKAEIVLAVDRDCRGQGVGTGLIEAAEKWAKKHGVIKLELTVSTDNEGAYRLYQKLGYEKVGERKKTTKVGNKYRDDYLMEKLLKKKAG
ncbi:GNAT family N-acetyltransferase [Patescibacteria group bacterium]